MEPFIGQIMLVGFNFAPRGWAFCNGQVVPINQNTALFALLGTTYGGNGQTTFALPDLRGRAPIGMGQGPGLSEYTQGQMAGTESVFLLSSQMPAHTHAMLVSSEEATTPLANGTFLARLTDAEGAPANSAITTSAPNAFLNQQSIGQAGGSLPHPNMQPYIAMNYIIALEGIFPPRS